jgi:hypothetical protein
MGKGRSMTFSLTIVEQDGPTVLAEIIFPTERLSVVAGIRLEAVGIVLYNLHIDGPGAGGLGVAGLRQIVDQVMELYDVEVLEIHGFRRTTGAKPGRIPGPLRFARRRRRS